MTEKQIYRRFLKVCPLRREAYDPTPENVRRWQWHTKQAEERAKGKPIVKNDWLLDAMRCSRWVYDFSQFPEEARAVYAAISGRFPGSQIWACGSRVRGDYVDGPDDIILRAARKLAGMKEKMQSDFDFWAAFDAEQVGELPENVDRCRVRVPEKEKIPIPMWDFDKLPPEEHEQVAAWIVQGEWGKLAAVHDKYSLSPHSYCCDPEGLKNWFWWGLKNGKINYDGTVVREQGG
jgi:hypothetical protein